MQYSSELAEKRFGCGLSPMLAAADAPEAMLAGLAAPDRMAVEFPIEDFETFRQRMIENAGVRKMMRQTRGTDDFKIHKKRRNKLNYEARRDMAVWYGQTLARWTWTDTPFRERLVAFWADHFTAHGKQGLVRRATSPYVETALRGRIAGQFEDLLIAAVTHPIMLIYFDQVQAVGPNSTLGLKSKGKRGLNENLAREVLELHTLGVDGRYTQDDVLQLAELFTGLSFSIPKGFVFIPQRAEPGAETVLGQEFYDDPATVQPIHDVLRALARHPDTARNITRKLAVHFVSDDPDPDLVAAMERAYLRTDGDLTAVYRALMEHPAAWEPELRNVKPPFDFIASACRALGVEADVLSEMQEPVTKSVLLGPMKMMGQDWQKPPGPDGWAEEDEAWVTPQGVSARLRWAMVVPSRLRRDLPDPRAFVSQALGRDVPEAVQFAAMAAERRTVGIGLVLASPAFQRR
ncbi:MAG: DUF1800 domain-containing protein [Paracoccaceae bacterium]